MALPTLAQFVVDRWAALSHKAPMRDDVRHRTASAVNGWAPPSWTGELHRRRLGAYMVLSAYIENVSRQFLDTTDQQDVEERREYGDAALVVEQIRSHLLGDTQEIVVPGAEAYDPDLDDRADPEPPADDATPEQQAAYQAELDALAEERAANADARVLADRQAFLRTWADDVHLALRLVDLEDNAVSLGDGVWLLGWDDARQRVVPTVMDPGCYFPVLPDTLDGYDYPERVHFAWEISGEEYPDGKDRLRRITYELTVLAPRYDEGVLAAGGDPEDAEILPDGAFYADGDPIDLGDGETFTPRVLVRQYPWDEDGVTSRLTCTVTDATWVLDDLRGPRTGIDLLDPERAAYRIDPATGDEVRDLDLGIDFLPVVHQPNTPPGGGHYGQSSLARVLQVLDDLQNADTDAANAAGTTGSPIIGVSGDATGGSDPLTGRRGQPLEVRPGEVWRLGANGSLDALDTSSQLAATREYVKHLQERLSVNSRLPAAVLGMVKPSEVPSGFAMQLSFGPLTSMIRTMRLVRSVKHPLMLKMVQRLYQANDALPPGPTPRAEIALGAFLPSDQAAVLEQVTTAYEKRVISLETAVTMLLEVGFSIDDVAEEVTRIEQRDYDGANALADATGDTAVVRERLGLPVVDEPTPTVVLPGLPGQPGTGGQA